MRTKILKMIAFCSLALIGLTSKAQGLENVVVEEYHTITAADAAFYNGIGNGSYTLAAGDKCYRVYIDMAPGYKLNRVYGSPQAVGGGPSPNPLDITTTTTFFNDDFFALTHLPGQTRRIDEGLAFDSYLTINRSGAGLVNTPPCGSSDEQVGVLRGGGEDGDGDQTTCGNYPGFTSPDGNIDGTAGTVQGFLVTTDFSALTADGNDFIMVNDAWTTLPASVGPTAANRVLIAQLTTGGNLSFHINVELSDPNSQLEAYVWNQSTSPTEAVDPRMTYPVPCLAATIDGITSNSPLCSTDALSLDATVFGTAPISYTWSGTGIFNPNNTSEDVTVTGAATGPYTLTVSNACGGDNDNVSVIVNTATTWYEDADVDGSGDPDVSQQSCTQPPGYVSNSNDECPEDGSKIDPGQCGCGVPDTDSDGDGTADCNDPCDNNTDGDPCDDLDPCTINDMLDNCVCAGVAGPDSDGDGILDCNDDCPNLAGEQGDPCDDLDSNTTGDVITAACVCAGVLANDCEGVPGGPAQPGTPCDDSDVCTTGDIWDANCICTGTFQDADSDGICDANDPCDNNTDGDPCDDLDPCTINDMLDNCVCAGVAGPDSDGDGILDCNDDCPNLAGEQGDPCDDLDPNTTGDVITAACVCAGVLTNDCEGVPGGPAQPGTPCDDSDVCTTGDTWDANCICTGTFQDADSDGICDANDPCDNNTDGDPCDDLDPCTINDMLDNCVCAGVAGPDSDGDGILDCNDDCPNLAGEQGDPCDDLDPNTTGDVITAACVCAGVLTTDCEGVPGGPAQPGTPCDDSDVCTTGDTWDANCICTGTFQDADGDGTCDASDGCPADPDKIAAGVCGCGFDEPGTACNDLDPGTIGDVIGANCICAGTPSGCTEILTLDLTLDDFGSETTVELYDETGTILIDGSGPYSDGIGGTVMSEQFCVNPGCYRLKVLDSGNDGISSGGYVLKNAAGKRIIDANGLFSSSSAMIREFCVPLSNQRLINASCDRIDLTPNSVVYCLTQPGATGYVFWWFDPHGSYSRRIQLSTPSMKPKQMVTLPAPLGLELNVRISAFVGGNYTPFGPACTAVVNPPVPMSEDVSYHNMLSGEEFSADLTIHPNPNRDGVVYLAIDGLEDETRNVTIDVYDLFGKRVHAEQITVSGEVVYHVMDLSADLAMGMYMVNVSVGDQHFTQRLIKE